LSVETSLFHKIIKV